MCQHLANSAVFSPYPDEILTRSRARESPNSAQRDDLIAIEARARNEDPAANRENRNAHPARTHPALAINALTIHLRGKDATARENLSINIPFPLENQNFYSDMILLASDWNQTMATISHRRRDERVKKKREREREGGRGKKYASHKFVNRLANSRRRGREFMRFSYLSRRPQIAIMR